MSGGWTLSLVSPAALRLDLRKLDPLAMAALSQAEVERLPLGLGPHTVPLAECFRVQAGAGDGLDLRLQGDLSRCDRVGWQMSGGHCRVEGSVGDYLGAGLRGGELTVTGDARDLAACEMAGGRLVVQGRVGHLAASGLPGSMDGMRGGTFVVGGDVGDRFGDRMRRGTAVLLGQAGDFLASRMVAGTVLLAGRAGAHLGWGMRRGSLVLADPAQQAALPASFVPAGAEAPVFWQLLSRDLARLVREHRPDSPLAELPRRGIQRWLGDLAAGGKGELILPR